MDEEIRQIAERLKGLRDALDLEIADVAADCGLSVDEYAALESGEHDLSVSLLQRIARKYGITLDELKNDGIIDFNTKEIIILDRARLKDFLFDTNKDDF